MDWSAFVNLLFASVILQTMTEAAVESLGSEAGRSIYETLSNKTGALINFVRSKFSKMPEHDPLRILESLNDSDDFESRQKELERTLKTEISDAASVQKMMTSYIEIKLTIIDILKTSYTTNDLDELNARLGFRPGDLYSVSAVKFQKVTALLDKIEAQRRFHDLIKQMLVINPYLA